MTSTNDVSRTQAYEESWTTEFFLYIEALSPLETVNESFTAQSVRENTVCEALQLYYSWHPITAAFHQLSIATKLYVASNLFQYCNEQQKLELLNDANHFVRAASENSLAKSHSLGEAE
ncbi:hypothetical protein [Vibrio sp. R78045]|uniref:hypothetical protein n=1 Tax=Vibrio sp. R78045 TaxID=3093868 RepID=UPI0036F30E67